MKTKILKTEQEYNDACERIYTLINCTEKAIEPDSLEGEEIELLSLLVEKYEQEHFPVEAPNPIEAIKFRMEQMNLKQSDVAPCIWRKNKSVRSIAWKTTIDFENDYLIEQISGNTFRVFNYWK